MKKLLCLIICLFLIVHASVSGAAENITIIVYSGTLPPAGTTAAQKPEIRVPAGKHYHYVPEKSGWLVGTDDNISFLPADTVFVKGETYFMYIYFEPDDGYEFASDVEIDCKTNTILTAGMIYSSDFYAITARFRCPKGENTSLNNPKSFKVKSKSKKEIKVSWKKLSDKERKKARKIHIQVAKDSQFVELVFDGQVSSSKNYYIIKSLKKNTQYYVRIRAFNPGKTINQCSLWSAVKSVRTKKK